MPRARGGVSASRLRRDLCFSFHFGGQRPEPPAGETRVLASCRRCPVVTICPNMDSEPSRLPCLVPAAGRGAVTVATFLTGPWGDRQGRWCRLWVNPRPPTSGWTPAFPVKQDPNTFLGVDSGGALLTSKQGGSAPRLHWRGGAAWGARPQPRRGASAHVALKPPCLGYP